MSLLVHQTIATVDMWKFHFMHGTTKSIEPFCTIGNFPLPSLSLPINYHVNRSQKGDTHSNNNFDFLAFILVK